MEGFPTLWSLPDALCPPQPSTHQGEDDGADGSVQHVEPGDLHGKGDTGRVSQGAGRQRARQGRSCLHLAPKEMLLMLTPTHPLPAGKLPLPWPAPHPYSQPRGTTQTPLPIPALETPNRGHPWHPTAPLSPPLTYLKERTMAVTIPVTMTTIPSTQKSPGHDVKSTCRGEDTGHMSQESPGCPHRPAPHA